MGFRIQDIDLGGHTLVFGRVACVELGLRI